MASTKVKQHIDTGLWYKDWRGYVASAFWDLGAEGGQYRLNYHKGRMPAHASRVFESLEELEQAMREFQPDMRCWRYVMD